MAADDGHTRYRFGAAYAYGVAHQASAGGLTEVQDINGSGQVLCEPGPGYSFRTATGLIQAGHEFTLHNGSTS